MSDGNDDDRLRGLRPEFDALRSSLEDILVLLHGLPGAVAAAVRLATVERRGTLREADRQLLAILLPEISAAIGDCGFTVRWLIGHAMSADTALLDALEAATGSLDHGTARRIGKLLHRAEDFVLNGLHVGRVGATRKGVLWCVRDVSRVFPRAQNTQTRRVA